MADRSVRLVARPAPGPGTGILHPFPTAELPHLDPFVFLDTGAPLGLGTGEIYVGPHPHRGVQPVSLLFRGLIEHRDSLGNHTTVESGGIQWLVSGAGALHEEILNGDEDGVFHMAQLWVNLPADLKWQTPQHHALPASAVPRITRLGTGATVSLFAGELDGRHGPAPLPVQVTVAHVALAPGGEITLPAPTAWTCGLTVVDGSAAVDGETRLPPGATPVFEHDGDSVTVASVDGAEFLFMAGEPIGEPIAYGGGFVMNTRDEIQEAYGAYHRGEFGVLEPSR